MEWVNGLKHIKCLLVLGKCSVNKYVYRPRFSWAPRQGSLWEFQGERSWVLRGRQLSLTEPQIQFKATCSMAGLVLGSGNMRVNMGSLCCLGQQSIWRDRCARKHSSVTVLRSRKADKKEEEPSKKNRIREFYQGMACGSKEWVKGENRAKAHYRIDPVRQHTVLQGPTYQRTWKTALWESLRAVWEALL